MPGIPAHVIPSLKELYAFRSLSNQEMAKVAEVADLVELSAGSHFVVPPGVEAPFYMVLSGQVSLVEDRGGGKSVKDPYLFKMGQFFGADWILYNKNRRLIVTAERPTRLLRLSAAGLRELLLNIPAFKEGLLYASRIQKWLHSKPFDWIEENELVYLITRKHSMFLLAQLIQPLLMLLGAGMLFGLSAVVAISSLRVVLIWIGILVAVIGVLWLIWRYIDWGNDYYVVTDQRIAWVEQVLGIYESRREAFLSSIRSIQTSTAHWFERRFGYGDIIVTVFAGQITFKNIPEPEAVRRLIELLFRRAEVQVQKESLRETQKMLLERIRDVDKIMRDEVEIPPPPPSISPKTKQKLFPTWQDVRAYFHFETRFQLGEVITYRTHHVYLLTKQFPPLLLLFATWVGVVIAIRGELQGQTIYPTIPTTILLGIVLTFFALGWALYHFADWRNDIYQITPDKLLDKYHKPFQEERIVQAFINDILSMEIERDNPIEVLFNIGTVVINTGTAQKLTFDDIPNPARAMQDIYNRLYKLRREQELAEKRRQIDQSAWMLATYHYYERRRGDFPEAGSKLPDGERS